MPESDRLRLELCLATVEAARLAIRSNWAHTFGHADSSVATYIHACDVLKALGDLRRSLGMDLSGLLSKELGATAQEVP